VAAQSVVLAIGVNHHGHRVPPNDALDAGFDSPIARIRRFLRHRDSVQVRSRGRGRDFDSGLAKAFGEIVDKEAGLLRALLAQDGFDDVFEGFEPETSLLLRMFARTTQILDLRNWSGGHFSLFLLRFHFVSHAINDRRRSELITSDMAPHASVKPSNLMNEENAF
jgi:hypothetical protein